MNILHSKYFDLLTIKNITEGRYELYKPRGYPLVLKSKTGIMLACIQIFCDKCLPITSMLTSNESPRCQVIFPNITRKHPIIFTITNLTDIQIKIDFMKDSNPITMTNEPERSLNAINEIKPFKTGVIRSDQTCDDRRLFISPKKISDGNNISTKSDLLYITCSPALGSGETRNLFKDSIWTCPNFIIIQKEFNIVTIRDNIPNIDEYIHLKPLPEKQPLFEDSEIIEDSAISENSDDPIVLDKCESSSSFIRDNVLSSIPAELKYGEKITYSSYETGLAYDYNLSSPQCIFGMSIVNNVSITDDVLPTDNDLNEYIDNVIKNTITDIISKNKLFKTTECVICLENSPSITTIRCGHTCLCDVCSEKIHKCPLCRSHVIAKIPYSKIEC